MSATKAGIVCVAAGMMVLATGGHAAGVTASDVMFTPSVSAASSSSSCAGSGAAAAPLRAAVDALDDGWRATSATHGLESFILADMGAPSSPVASHPTTMTFPGSPVIVAVSLRDVPASQIPAYGGPAGDPGVGSLAAVNLNGPTIGVSSTRTMQDCAPFPASLYGASAASQAPMWNENAGNGSTLNGVLFDFSTPVQSFGAWWGDLESRPVSGGNGGNGTPAWVKLFDAAGAVIWEGPVPADEGIATDAQCGGPLIDTDLVGCGNQATRWIGFSLPIGESVSRMLVTVGDDDSCAQTPLSQCDGSTEHMSFVGATLAVVADGSPLATTTTSTSTTSTSSTSTTTTIDPDTSSSTTTIDPDTTTSTTTVDPDTSSTTTSTTTTVDPDTSSTTSSTSSTTTVDPDTSSTTSSTSSTTTVDPDTSSTSSSTTTTVDSAAGTTTTNSHGDTTSTGPSPITGADTQDTTTLALTLLAAGAMLCAIGRTRRTS